MRALLFATVLGASACLNPDDVFPVQGRVVSAAGLEGVRVDVFREPDVSGRCRFERVSPLLTTQTGADGTFHFELLRAQVTSLTDGQFFCFEVRAHFDSGAESFAILRAFEQENDVGALYDWVPHARLEGALVRFDPVLPQGPVEIHVGVPYSIHKAQLDAPSGPVFEAFDWLFDADGGADPLMHFPAEATEDFTGDLTLEAQVLTFVRHDDPLMMQVDQKVVWVQSAERLAVAGSTPSVIRGLPCGNSPLGICPLNDGLMAIAAFDFSSGGGLEVTLPTPVAVHALVLRGVAATGNTLELSGVDPDGGAIGPLSFQWSSSVWRANDQLHTEFLPDGGVKSVTVAGDFVVLPVDAGTFSALRVDFPNGLISGEELSVF